LLFDSHEVIPLSFKVSLRAHCNNTTKNKGIELNLSQ
jgi:hypothetical protein